MADVRAFFEKNLPQKLQNNPKIAEDVNAVYQFDLGDEGNWVVDMKGEGSGEVREGTADAPDCTVTAAGSDFGKLLDNPASAMMLFTMGKLKVSNISLGMALQKLLG